MDDTLQRRLAAAVLMLSLGLSGCGGRSTAPAEPEPTSAPAIAAAKSLGISLCDEFLDRYAACIEQAPAEAKATMRTALATWRGTWTPLSANPLMRDVLAQSCTTAASTVDGQLRAFGC